MKDKNNEKENISEEKSNPKLYFYAAIVCASLGAVSFGLAFTLLAIYALICSILFEILAVGLCGMQKRKNNFKGLLPLTVVCYSFLAAFIMFFIGGIIYTAL